MSNLGDEIRIAPPIPVYWSVTSVPRALYDAHHGFDKEAVANHLEEQTRLPLHFTLPKADTNTHTARCVSTVPLLRAWLQCWLAA
jgi:hypothetical protein